MKRKLDTVVKILGTPWRIIICSSNVEPRLETTNGFTDWTSKTICVEDWEGIDTSLDNPVEFTKKIIRHEVVHAFMFESGLNDDWEHRGMGQEETVVDWIAIQMPKMIKTIEEIEKQVDWYGEK